MSTFKTLLLYFFEPLPSGPFKYLIIISVIAAIFLIGSIGLRFIIRKKKEDKIFKKMFRSLPGKLLIIAIFLGIYLFSRYARIPFLSMRVLEYLILAIAAYLIIQNIRKYLLDYPKAKEKHLEKIESNKYLPRKKKK
jgi:uncharacterized membrane protein SirB2